MSIHKGIFDQKSDFAASSAILSASALTAVAKSCTGIRNGQHALTAWRGIVWSGIICWMLAGSFAMAQAPQLVLDSFLYSSSAAAQAAWPVTAGTNAAQSVTAVHGPGVIFPYIYTQGGTDRATWDKTVSLDLSSCRYLQFQVNGPVISGLRNVQVSFRTSSGGWWSSSYNFSNQFNGQWQSIVMPLANFIPNGGTCNGWGAITQIRISTWQGGVITSGHVIFKNMLATSDMLIDSMAYSTPSAAQAAWTIMAGSANGAQLVQPATVGGVSCLSLPYIFTESHNRGAWGKAVSLDLSSYTHIQFKLNAATQPLNAQVGFQTGNGDWLTCSVYCFNDQWQTFVVPKTSFTGGTGWNDIREILIVAWQGSVSTGSLSIADLRAMSSTSANILANGGFEITNMENLPDCWGSGDITGTGSFALYYEPWVVNAVTWRSYWGVDRTVSHSGTNSLKVVVPSPFDPNLTQLSVYSNQFAVNANQSYTFSAWFKSDCSMPVCMIMKADNVVVNQTFNVSTRRAVSKNLERLNRLRQT